MVLRQVCVKFFRTCRSSVLATLLFFHYFIRLAECLLHSGSSIACSNTACTCCQMDGTTKGQQSASLWIWRKESSADPNQPFRFQFHDSQFCVYVYLLNSAYIHYRYLSTSFRFCDKYRSECCLNLKHANSCADYVTSFTEVICLDAMVTWFTRKDPVRGC